MDTEPETEQRDKRRSAQRELANAAMKLAAHGRLSLSSLLEAYVRLAPSAHSGADSSLPDLSFLQHAHAFANLPLAGAKHWLVAPRGARTETLFHATKSPGVVRIECTDSLSALADLLTLALGICLEGQKLRKLLQDVDVEKDASAWLCGAMECESDALSRAFGVDITAERDVNACICQMVEQGDELILHRIGPTAATAHVRTLPETEINFPTHTNGPLFVVAGATERIHDLLSPYIRRLQVPLQNVAALPGPDAPYVALSVLNQAEPRAHDERLVIEAEDGFVPAGDALLVTCAMLAPAHVDARAKRAMQKLKQSHCRLVLCDHSPERLAAVLRIWGKDARAVVLLNEGFHGIPTYAFPNMLEDVATGHVLPLQNRWPHQPDAQSVPVSLSVPSLGMSSMATPCTDTSLFALATECFRAKGAEHLSLECPVRSAISRVDLPETFTLLSISVLEDLAQTLEHTQARAPSPLWQRQFLR